MILKNEMRILEFYELSLINFKELFFSNILYFWVAMIILNSLFNLSYIFGSIYLYLGLLFIIKIFIIKYVMLLFIISITFTQNKNIDKQLTSV